MPLTSEQSLRLKEIRAIRSTRKRQKKIKFFVFLAIIIILLIGAALVYYQSSRLKNPGMQTPNGCVVGPDGKTILC